MNLNEKVFSEIIKEQENIIGPLALDLANHVKGVSIDSPSSIHIQGNPKDVIEHLVKEYAKLFGDASIEACKDAVRSIRPQVPNDSLPSILQEQ